MNLSINGQSQVPPGFRFHPTEEELLQYYLRKKVTPEKIDHLDVIPYVDLNKLEPWDIQEKCKIGSTPQNEWYFFNHKDKKYPTGSRTNRATEAGFWKATGRDKVVYNNVGRIGLRKTLVFYIGRAPCGQKSDWIMYEYRLDENTQNDNVCNLGEPKAEDGWVICRLFRKKNYNKSQDSPQSSSISTDVWTQIHNLSNDGDLDQVLRCMDKPCKQENETMSNITSNNTMEFHNNSLDKAIGDRFLDRFTNLPELESPTIPLNDQECSFEEMLVGFKPSSCTQQVNPCNSDTVDETEDQGLNEWLGLDQLLASKFNGQVETSKQLSCCDECSKDFDHHLHVPQLCSNRPNQASQVHSNDMDLWSFT